MSVIVTEMDMPETCYSCKFCQEDDQLRDYCGITYDAIWYGEKERLKDCPLKPIEGLIEEIEKYWMECDDLLQAPTLRGVRKIIKEYCEVEE